MAKKPVVGASASTDEKQSKPWLFKPGQSGNPKGRPEGSKNKITEEFLSALAADFEQHGPTAIREMREKDPGGYVRVVAQLVPTESKHEIKGSVAFERIWRAIGEGELSKLTEDADGKSVN